MAEPFEPPLTNDVLDENCRLSGCVGVDGLKQREPPICLHTPSCGRAGGGGAEHRSAGLWCCRFDFVTAAVSATSISFCKPKLAEVCPTAVSSRNFKLNEDDVTASS